jgi:hypothetical protein
MMDTTVSKRPLVVILQELTKKEVARASNGYVYLQTKEQVKQDIIDEALVKQNEYFVEDSRDAMNKAIQQHLDNKAKELRYDNMMSTRSYTGYENPYQDEAQKLAVWCSDCWAKAGEIEADVLAGNREMPTVDELIAELPVYE